MLIYLHLLSRTSQVVLVVKNQPANAGDVRVWVLSLDQEDTLQEDMTTYSRTLACRIPWKRNLAGYNQ